MMKKVEIIFCFFLFSLLVACVSAPFEYSGEYRELYSVAIYSIPDTVGYLLSETYQNPRIDLIESDQYGRQMFLYYEGNNVSTFSLVILQYSNENEVCFIFGKNYISSSTEDFSEMQISQLKSDNDWDAPLSENACECMPISTSKEPLPLSYEQIKPFYETVFPGNEHFSDDRWIRYFLTDDFGRVLVTVEARNKDEWAMMMFNPDQTYDAENGYVIFSDFFTYQDQLRNFLDHIGWNEPL